MPVIK